MLPDDNNRGDKEEIENITNIKLYNLANKRPDIFIKHRKYLDS